MYIEKVNEAFQQNCFVSFYVLCAAQSVYVRGVGFGAFRECSVKCFSLFVRAFTKFGD